MPSCNSVSYYIYKYERNKVLLWEFDAQDNKTYLSTFSAAPRHGVGLWLYATKSYGHGAHETLARDRQLRLGLNSLKTDLRARDARVASVKASTKGHTHTRVSHRFHSAHNFIKTMQTMRLLAAPNLDSMTRTRKGVNHDPSQCERQSSR